jgi:hypothetical protein
VVPDKISLIAISARILRSLGNGSDISFLENVWGPWGAGLITSMNLKTFLPTCFANASSEMDSFARVCLCIKICSFYSRCR